MGGSGAYGHTGYPSAYGNPGINQMAGIGQRGILGASAAAPPPSFGPSSDLSWLSLQNQVSAK